MNGIIDSHLHLTDEAFIGEERTVIERARDKGVAEMVTVGLNQESSQHCLELSRSYKGLYATAGIHPAQAERFDLEAAAVREMLAGGDFVAVGEIGLDYFRAGAPREHQVAAFRKQVEWSLELGLPVIVHDREAHDDVLAVLTELRPKGVLHCFSGDAAMAERAVALGLYVSFAGNVTYKSARNLHDAVRAVPLTSILVETDAPYLSPRSVRGQRNEPANIVETAQAVAHLLGIELGLLASATAANTRNLFGLPSRVNENMSGDTEPTHGVRRIDGN